MTYTIKSISQPEKVWTLHRSMLIPVNHTLLTVDETPNIYPIKIKLPKKVKSALRKEAIEHNQKDLLKPSDASESDEEGLELTKTQLLQLHSIIPQVPK